MFFFIDIFYRFFKKKKTIFHFSKKTIFLIDFFQIKNYDHIRDPKLDISRVPNGFTRPFMVLPRLIFRDLVMFPAESKI